MKISKADARTWYAFFAEMPEDEELSPRQQEIAIAVLQQIETAVERDRAAQLALIPGLRDVGGRTLAVGPEGKFPPGCRSCLFGTGLTAVRKTNRCNLQCPFCYDYGCLEAQEPIGEGLWEIGGTRYREEDVDLLLSVSRRPTGVAYVYLEPFMEIEAYEGIIRRFHKAGVHQHMYTNGTLCTEANLDMLARSGLDELRFNLGATLCSDRVIDAVRMAAARFPHVGIETPMTPELYGAFLQKKDAILSTGVEFINFAELHLNPNNIDNYFGEPLYCARMGYISPISSRRLTLEMMRTAGEEGWPVLVHDCSNRTKFVRDLNLKAREGGWFGATTWAMEFDRIPFAAFLPTLEDPDFVFAEEEPLPAGYRPGDLTL